MQAPGLSTDLAPPRPDEEPVVPLVAAEDAARRSQAAAAAEERTPMLRCSACGYGIARSTPPDRCPMCQSEDAWVYAGQRPFAYA
jgi:uncharacterized OB-fold protein